MNFLKSLFTADKAIERVSAGVDAAWFTEEEKASNFHWLLRLYEPFKLAQRLLALVFCLPYALAFLVTFAASFYVDVAEQLTLLQGDMAIIVGIIIAFYFGGGAVEGVIKGRRSG